MLEIEGWKLIAIHNFWKFIIFSLPSHDFIMIFHDFLMIFLKFSWNSHNLLITCKWLLMALSGLSHYFLVTFYWLSHDFSWLSPDFLMTDWLTDCQLTDWLTYWLTEWNWLECCNCLKSLELFQLAMVCTISALIIIALVYSPFHSCFFLFSSSKDKFRYRVLWYLAKLLTE